MGKNVSGEWLFIFKGLKGERLKGYTLTSYIIITLYSKLIVSYKKSRERERERERDETNIFV